MDIAGNLIILNNLYLWNTDMECRMRKLSTDELSGIIALIFRMNCSSCFHNFFQKLFFKNFTGLALSKSTCYYSTSRSVSGDIGLQTALIVAHETAHTWVRAQLYSTSLFLAYVRLNLPLFPQEEESEQLLCFFFPLSFFFYAEKNNPFIPNRDQDLSSPFNLWAAVCSKVWKKWANYL